MWMCKRLPGMAVLCSLSPSSTRGVCCPRPHEEEWGFLKEIQNHIPCRTRLEAARAFQAAGVLALAMTLPHPREQAPGCLVMETYVQEHQVLPELLSPGILGHSQENPNQDIDVKHLQRNLYGNAFFSKQALLMCC